MYGRRSRRYRRKKRSVHVDRATKGAAPPQQERRWQPCVSIRGHVRKRAFGALCTAVEIREQGEMKERTGRERDGVSPSIHTPGSNSSSSSSSSSSSKSARFFLGARGAGRDFRPLSARGSRRSSKREGERVGAQFSKTWSPSKATQDKSISEPPVFIQARGKQQERRRQRKRKEANQKCPTKSLFDPVFEGLLSFRSPFGRVPSPPSDADDTA